MKCILWLTKKKEAFKIIQKKLKLIEQPIIIIIEITLLLKAYTFVSSILILLNVDNGTIAGNKNLIFKPQT